MTAADKIAAARALIEPLRTTVLWQNANPNVMKAADLLAALADLADAQAQENAKLRAAARDAIEIIKDSWGEDQIEAGDDQACNVLLAALGDAP